MNTKISSIFAILCSSCIWAIAFIPTRYLGTQGVSVFSEIFIRYLIPACVLFFFFRSHIQNNISLDNILKAMLTGAILWIALVFAIYGVRKIEHGSMGLLLVTLYVLLVPLASAFLYKKIPSLRLIVCAILCFSGVSLLVIGQPLGTPNIGTLLCFLASIFYASYLILCGIILEKTFSVVVLHFYQSITAVLLCIPFMIIIEEQSLITIISLAQEKTPLLLALAFTGFCSGLLAYQLLFFGQKHLTPTLVVILLSTKNVFGAILDVTIFHLPITAIQYVAYATVIISTAIASTEPVQKKS